MTFKIFKIDNYPINYWNPINTRIVDMHVTSDLDFEHVTWIRSWIVLHSTKLFNVMFEFDIKLKFTCFET